jgi:peptide/nickel transport system substrate-binding protein
MPDRRALHDYSDSRAVLIGTWNYEFLTPVPPARNSLRRMEALLAGPLCGWPQERLLVLGDEPSPGDLPDRLVTAFEDIGDVALFYYVGHGQISPDDQLCLGLVRSRTEANRRAATSLKFSDVRGALQGSSATTKIVILDCCFAGLATTSSLAGLAGDVLDMTAGTGAYTMAATSEYATAWYEDDPTAELPQTYFTKYLVDLVERGIPGQPAGLRLDPLYRRLRDDLAADRRPIPHSRAVNDAREFVFASNAAPAHMQRDPEREMALLSQRLSESDARIRALQAEAAEQAAELTRLREQAETSRRMTAEEQRDLRSAIDTAERRLDDTKAAEAEAAAEAAASTPPVADAPPAAGTSSPAGNGTPPAADIPPAADNGTPGATDTPAAADSGAPPTTDTLATADSDAPPERAATPPPAAQPRPRSPVSPARPTPAPRPGGRGRRRRAWLAAVSGAAVCVVTAVIVTLALTSSPAKPSPGLPNPVPGGTLNLAAYSGPDQLDPAAANEPADYTVERAYTRQLMSYPSVPATSVSSAQWQQDVTPVPDAAAQVPSIANGGITDDAKTYTFHIRQGVMWNTSPPSQVTAADFIRGFKALCAPFTAPATVSFDSQSFDEATISGFASYCSAESTFFANSAHSKTAAQVANYQNSHSIPGITAPDLLTLRFTLTAPASDFLNILAMPAASARPVEYDSYLPGSAQLQAHTISDGPYQISSYASGKSMTMVRNLAWRQSADPLRHDYPNNVLLTADQASAQTQQSDIQAGSEDLMVDTPLSPGSVAQLAASRSADFAIWPETNLSPYLVFNLRSPDAGGATQKLLVRQAVEYGLDKSAVRDAEGGPAAGTVTNTVLPPGSLGYQNNNLYADDGGQGNPTQCRNDLARAGYPHGITLSFVYPDDGAVEIATSTAVTNSLAECGITLTGKPMSFNNYFAYITDATQNNKSGRWDITLGNWSTDWDGDNGRTIVPALLQGPACVEGTTNYGCYDDPVVDSLINKAETASSAEAAGGYWQQADVQVMKDAAIVPIDTANLAIYASKRVRGVLPDGKSYPTAIVAENIGAPDITNLWLSQSG